MTEWEHRRSFLEEQHRDAARRASENAQTAQRLDRALGVLQGLETSWRRGYEQAFAQLVSQGLSAVFGEEIEVTIESTVKRGATSMRLLLRQGDVVLGDIVDGTGGSIVSALSVLLRVLLVTSVPGMRRLVVLDEPFGMVAPDHLPAIGQLLRELSERLGLQFVIVSHEAELQDSADVVYEVKKRGSQATVVQTKQYNEERI